MAFYCLHFCSQLAHDNKSLNSNFDFMFIYVIEYSLDELFDILKTLFSNLKNILSNLFDRFGLRHRCDKWIDILSHVLMLSGHSRIICHMRSSRWIAPPTVKSYWSKIPFSHSLKLSIKHLIGCDLVLWGLLRHTLLEHCAPQTHTGIVLTQALDCGISCCVVCEMKGCLKWSCLFWSQSSSWNCWWSISAVTSALYTANSSWESIVFSIHQH